jgi:hypothetical protein
MKDKKLLFLGIRPKPTLMIIDNENQKLKVHEWITNYNEEGNIEIVTGYITVGV